MGLSREGPILHYLTDMTIKGVTIGDMFIDPRNRKSKRVSTVVDFIEHRQMITGEVKYTVIAEHSFMGQVVRTEVVPTTVLMNKF